MQEPQANGSFINMMMTSIWTWIWSG